MNNGILAGNFDKVIEGSLYMAVFSVASMLFATACAWYAARVGEEVGHRLRMRVYRRVTELSWGNVDRLETSDLLVRLTTDVNQVRVMTTSSVTTLLRAPLMIVGAILVLLWVDVRLALVMLVFLPIVIAVLAFYQLKGAPLYRAVLARFDGLNQVLQENMAGVRVVQAFVRRDYENARFDRENNGLQHVGDGRAELGGVPQPGAPARDQPRARRRALGRRRPRDRREDRAGVGLRAPELPGRGDDPARSC